MIEMSYQIVCETDSYFDVVNPTTLIVDNFPVGSVISKEAWPAVHKVIQDEGFVFSSAKNAYVRAEIGRTA